MSVLKTFSTVAREQGEVFAALAVPQINKIISSLKFKIQNMKEIKLLGV